MHIIIGALGSIVTILWLLHRLAEMGIDLGGLNPWLWQRRRHWKQKFEGNPIFGLDDPMEVTALLIAGIAKSDGDISLEEKTEILSIFENEFQLSKRDAAGLLLSTTHLLGRGDEFSGDLTGILKPSQDAFTEHQAKSAVELMERMAAVGGGATETKSNLVTTAREVLLGAHGPKGTWH
ncbi:MAG: TerB family tellurite resistance protein [Gammaproteobacteria bacterium]